MIVSFVLSGGIGSRLWPLSREDNPKQFHHLAGQGSMLARTLHRLTRRKAGAAPLHVIAAERHAERVHSDLAGVDLAGGRPIFEPVGRNTAAAVALATLETLSRFGDQLVLVVPSDHEISSDDQFWQSVETGVEAAEAGRIVVFGVRPAHAETGYGYIETGSAAGGIANVLRFVEKPDRDAAAAYVESGSFFWNAGIFLFKASTMRAAFKALRPDIWNAVEAAFAGASSSVTGTYLPASLYADVPSTSVDYAIMERASDIAMVRAAFRWNDLGSWQSLLQVGPTDAAGNVVMGDVVAVDCENSYIRSEGRLLSVVGLRDVAVVATADATFIAPVERSQHVRTVFDQLERSGRLETRFTPAHDRIQAPGAWRVRVRHWLFHETLPLWSDRGVDHRHGGFHEALDFHGDPLVRPKRMRTLARQVYAFATAGQRGWNGPVDALIAHGLDFMNGKGRTAGGGWVRALHADGSVADATEDAYDHACVLLALAHARACGNPDADQLGKETLAFIDAHLMDPESGGYFETSAGRGERRSNPHMHLLEAFLAWHQVTGETDFLRRAGEIIRLFRDHFFDADSWTLGEFFDDRWMPVAGERMAWTEPGHHFEWASLLVDFAERSGQPDLAAHARKLYASAIANGLNRATGLAYGAVSRSALPLDRNSRSWPQAEALKAAIALDRVAGPDLKPEIEQRVAQLFRWHIEAAPTGMWIDQIDERGRARASDVPASIFYHLVTALTQYLDATDNADKASGVQNGLTTSPVST